MTKIYQIKLYFEYGIFRVSFEMTYSISMKVISRLENHKRESIVGGLASVSRSRALCARHGTYHWAQ
jgi:hypothetical protein